MIDNALMLKDAGAMTESGACTVDGVAKVIDLGVAAVECKLLLYLNSVKVSTGDEKYIIALEFKKTVAEFANDEATGPIIYVTIDASETETIGEQTESPQIVPFGKDKDYRFARLYVEVSGTEPSIDFTAYLDRN